MKVCKHYEQHVDEYPSHISTECFNRKGMYEDSEIEQNFWKRSERIDGYNPSCKFCCRKKASSGNGEYDPVITKDHPRDENGRLLSYWHLIDRDIILKMESD